MENRHSHSLRPLRLALPIRSAFTLVELVVVLLVTGIFAALTAPAFVDSLMFHRVESAARRVKSDLELARSAARLKSVSRTVTFTGASYLIANVASLDNPAGTYSVDLSASPYFIDTVDVNFNNTTAITFDGYGVPSASGTIVLAAKSHQCTLTVHALTGQVSLASNHPHGGSAQVGQ